MNKIKDKLANFVAQLTDEEIEEQLGNIFQWAQIYQNLLEKEQEIRSHKEYSSGLVPAEPDDLEDYEEIGSQTAVSPNVDYYYAQAIQEKLSRMSENDIQSSLDSLKGVDTSHFNDQEKELLKFEIDACELYLHDIRHDVEENQLCPQCGNYLPLNARFCTKCGTKITNEEEY